jgi:aldose sugar dehydrogenase
MKYSILQKRPEYCFSRLRKYYKGLNTRDDRLLTHMHGARMYLLPLLLILALALCSVRSSYPSEGPSLNSDKFFTDEVVSNLEYPTGIAFLGQNDILAIEKDRGTVQRIIDGNILPEPLLDVNVANMVEQGMLGIAVSKNSSNDKTYVFLFYTEAKNGAGEQGAEEDNNEDGEQSRSGDGGEPAGNRLYRYELSEDGTKLVNPKLLLDLPYEPGPAHNGGVISIGPDNNVYVIIGNLVTGVYSPGEEEETLDQNVIGGKDPDGRGGILRVTQDGQLVDGKGILGDEHPLDMYYAYGIRNGFGMDFDPVTGILWDTENGGQYDEINLVDPGFNSGWAKIVGKASIEEGLKENDLVDFGGKGKYSDPEFSWDVERGFRVGPTALIFFHSDKWGTEYENDIFVADTHGRIYHFDLNEMRTKLLLDGSLSDEVADQMSEMEDLIFAEFPGIITDLELGYDGYLYITTFNKNGTIYRILPQNIQ